ncbi:MAG: tetratricopeptide repeat protein [Magnetococcales bacterium]|nr:tetratricopeptide repeat protein [Magnetococcales bacterium]
MNVFKSSEPTYNKSQITVDEAYLLLVGHLNSERYAEAEQLCNAILNTLPNHIKAINILGVIAQKVNRHDLAVEQFTRALDIDKSEACLHHNIGKSLFHLERYEEAVVAFRKSLEIDYKNAQAHYELGVALNKSKKTEEAVVSYQKAILIKPDYADAYNNLGVILQDQKKTEEAVTSYQKAISFKPDNADAYSNLGNALQEQGKLDEAVASFQKAISIKPDNADACSNLGSALKEQGKLDEAVASFQKAISIKPDLVEAYYNLGLVLKMQGKLDEAVVSFQRAIFLKPAFEEVHNDLGMALQEQGKLDEAVTCYQKAISIKPDFARAFYNLGLVLQSISCEPMPNYRDALYIENVIDSLPTPPEPDIIRLQLTSVLSDDAQDAWKRVVRHFSAKKSEIHQHPNTSSISTIIKPKIKHQKRVVALLHFGRSGSGHLHSLLDNHPNITTLPGVYMSGFFGREVWKQICKKGLPGIPEQFSQLYNVLFNANCPDKIPPAFITDTYNESFVGVSEGFSKMGLNRDISLTLDRGKFISNLSGIINDLKHLDQGQLFVAIHDAFEKTLGNNEADKSLILYHIHKNDPYSMGNFISFFSRAKLLMIIRDPIQSCESWALRSVNNITESGYTNYNQCVEMISGMLVGLNSPVFRSQDSYAVRLEDITSNTKETMGRLCKFLKIEDAPSLYESTMQGLKWWGDPSSKLYGRTQTSSNWKDDPLKTKVGEFFNEHDQFILGTLFYPLSARFGYVKRNDSNFRSNLDTILPLLGEPLDFEKKLAESFQQQDPPLEAAPRFKVFHSILKERWRILDEYGTYPNMLKPLLE